MLELLSEIDKWSQKYMLYRKTAAAFIALLMISIVVFFLTLNSIALSMACLIVIFIAVIGIRISLGKMDEFKSLYVNTVPMIDPEKEYNEEQSGNQTDDSSMEFKEVVSTLMDEFVEEVDQDQLITETLVEELTDEVFLISDQSNDEVETTELVMDTFNQTDDNHSLKTEDPTDSTQDLVAKEIGEGTVEMLEVSKPLPEIMNEVGVIDDVISDVQNEEQQIQSSEIVSQPEMMSESTEELTLEEQIVKMMTELLQRHQKDISILSSKVVGNYFTFYVGKRILCRLKLTGRKQYVLTQLSEEDVKRLNLQYEAPSKSEAYQSRVSFTDLSVLETLADHLVELYEHCI